MSILRPLRRKDKKRDREFLAFIHTMPCILSGSSCSGPITAHHAGERGLMQRADDRTALPACYGHHLTRKDSLHVLGKSFWSYHSLDKAALIAKYNVVFELERGIAA